MRRVGQFPGKSSNFQGVQELVEPVIRPTDQEGRPGGTDQLLRAGSGRPGDQAGGGRLILCAPADGFADLRMLVAAAGYLAAPPTEET